MKTLFLVLLVLALGTVVYYLFPHKRFPLDTQTIITPLPSPSNSISQPTIDASDLRAGGSSYKDSQNVYTILYPPDYKLDTSDPIHPRIYKTGATQRGQTEMYDGVIMVFETITLDGKTLDEWVNSQIKTATADGTSEVTEQKKAITQNNYPGFSYTLRGLGESNYLVLQKDATSGYAVVITTLVADPENVGFQQEVDKTLSTLELLK